MNTVDSSREPGIIATARRLRALQNILESRIRLEAGPIEVAGFMIDMSDTLTVLSESVEFGTTPVDHSLVESIAIIKWVSQVVKKQCLDGLWMAGPVVR